MPDSRRIQPRRPSRPSRPHSGQSLDPTLTRKGKLGHPGSFIIAFAGIVFFAYAFNAGGLKNTLDSFFGGLDARIRSHNDEVAKFVIVAFPYVAVAVGALLLFFVLSTIGRSARALVPKRNVKPAEKASPRASEATPVAREVIKPLRLPVRELDMKPRSTPPANESPAAE